jgi:hypothetical protein
MPSHRQGNIPKHRARRPDENSGGRSQLNAATQAKRIAPESSPDSYGWGTGPAAPEPPTQPLPQVGSYLAPPLGGGGDGVARGDGVAGRDGGRAREGGRAVEGRHGRVRRTPDGVIAGSRRAGPSRRMRGLLVTPWFAAGAGFVIAAALSLNAPRTILTFRPNNAPSQSKCGNCQSPESVPTSKPGVQIRSVDPAVIGGSGRSGPAVGIQLGSEPNGVFSVTFTLPPSQVGNGWKLQFALPGRDITQVVGAHWQLDAAGDGGVAAMPAQSGYVSPTSRAAVSFLVWASGSPVDPVHCVLNGQRCHFG